MISRFKITIANNVVINQYTGCRNPKDMIMKKNIIVIFTLLFACASTAGAQSDASITWLVSGLNNVSQLRLDVNFGTRFLASNGVVVQSSGDAVPIAGTCFQTAQGGVFCTFSGQQGSTIILDLQSSLNGTWRTIGISGQTIESGFLTLRDIF
ncbi:MAG: hypothetical protein Q7L19_10430 [Pseudohongiella sp.]|nr:hypothetical protein [Pseudohongiella sp.]